MKKLLVIFFVVFLLLVGAIVAVPFLFKGKIVRLIKQKVNEELVADVNFNDDIGLNLIRNFPNLTLSIQDLSVSGRDSFAGDTLLQLKEFRATLDLMSVISGDQVRVRSVLLDEAKINAIVLPGGKANWDITKPSDDTTTAPEGEESSFKVALKSYEIRNSDIIYDDRQSDMYASLDNFNHTGKGDFTQDVFILETVTKIDSMSFLMEGIPYLNKVNTELTCNLDMNLKEMRFAFKENNLRLNALELGMDGWLLMPEADIDMDLKLFAKKTDFKEVLSLIPAIYTKDFEKVQTSGKTAFNALLKGRYSADKETYPAFDVNFMIENGMFRYPDLPEALNKVQLDLKVDNKDGVLDNTVINMKKLHFELGKEPFDARMLVKRPMSNPYIDMAAKGKVVLDNVMKLVPLEDGMKVSGIVEADVKAKGNVSTLASDNYEAMDASGIIKAYQVTYHSNDLPATFQLDLMDMTVSPQLLTLNTFDSRVGHSDIKMKGTISNFFGYALRDNEVLHGNMEVQSQLFDANTFMSEDGNDQKEAPSPEDTVALEAVEVPANMDIKLGLKVDKLLYDNLVIENLTGKTIVEDRALRLDGVSMNIFDGKADLSGLYDTKLPQEPLLSMKMELKDLDIEKSFKYVNTVQKVAPVAKFLKGRVSSSLGMMTKLDKHMMPVMSTFTSAGTVTTSDAVLSGFTPLVDLADKLNFTGLKNLLLSNTNIAYAIENGKVYLKKDLSLKQKEFSLLVEQDGFTSFEQAISYKMKLSVPKSTLGVAGNALNNLVDQAAKNGIKLTNKEVIDINIILTGTIQKPQIQTSLGEFGKDVLDNLKDEGKKIIEEKKKELIDKGDKEVQKLIDEASRRGDQLIAEARMRGDQLRAAAKAESDLIVSEADKQSAKLVKDAGVNPVKKLAAEKAGEKIRSEARKKADQVNQKADQEANSIVAKAEAEKARLIKEAENKKNAVK